jgi:hypothetical protein
MVVQEGEFTSVPVIDIRALVNPAYSNAKLEVAKQIYDACRYEKGGNSTRDKLEKSSIK